MIGRYGPSRSDERRRLNPETAHPIQRVGRFRLSGSTLPKNYIAFRAGFCKIPVVLDEVLNYLETYETYIV